MIEVKVHKAFYGAEKLMDRQIDKYAHITTAIMFQALYQITKFAFSILERVRKGEQI